MTNIRRGTYWANKPVDGGGALRYDSVSSPNYQEGTTGWSANQDGSAQFNQLTLIVQSTDAALLIYVGAAASGTLVGSWSGAGGTDDYGNDYPAGLFAQSGLLQGLEINGGDIIQSTITDCLLQGPTITAANMQGGTSSEQTLTFDGGGGELLCYSSATATTTFSTGGNTTWTAPAGVTSAKVECWGAGAGAGGGFSGGGGEGGGAGEYAAEESYSIVPGTAYTVQVGSGGTGGTTGNAGSDGGQTSFDNQGVVANAGQAGSGGFGGTGGTGSPNSVHFNGGGGGNVGSSGTAPAGAGGGGSAGSSGAGATGGGSSGTTPGTGGAAGSGGGGTGGAGGLSGANGTSPTGVGAGGGGAGEGSSATSQSLSYRPVHTYSYYGNPITNSRRNTDGAMYENCASGLLNTTGTQYSFALYDYSTIRSDWSGFTIDSVSVEIKNSHSYENSGCYIEFGYCGFTTFASTGSLSGAHTRISTPWINQFATKTFDLTSSLKSVVATSNFTAIVLGSNSGSTNIWNYGYFNGGSSFGPLLQITGHTGVGGIEQGGNGQDGQVKITYSTTQTLVAAVSPSAGADPNGNSFAVGYTGPVQALVQGVSTATTETWHTITGAAGLTGTIRVKKVAENNMVICDICVSWTTTSATTFVLGSLPDSTYYPTTFGDSGGSRIYPVGHNSTSAATYSSQNIARLFVPSSGGLQVLVPTSTGGATNAACTVQWPVD